MVEEQQVHVRVGIELAPSITAMGEHSAALLEPGVALGVEPGSRVKEVADQPVNLAGVQLDHRMPTCTSHVEPAQLVAHARMVCLTDLFKIEARLSRDLQVSWRQGWQFDVGQVGAYVRMAHLFPHQPYPSLSTLTNLERVAIACVPCVGAILVIALGRRGQGEYKIRPYPETEDTSG